MAPKVTEARAANVGPGDDERRAGPARWFADLPIGTKLGIGFASVVALTLIVVALGSLASARATTSIDRTTDLRAPTALGSARAQANVLRMVGDVQAYLALGDPQYRDGYEAARAAFDLDFARLQALTAGPAAALDPLAAAALGDRLAELASAYGAWLKLPDRLFTIRDDQLQREPALRILIEEASDFIGPILVSVNDLSRDQRRREPTAANLRLLGAIGDYQSSFLGVVVGLRGYVTTGRDSFKFEYTSNATINETAWADLLRLRRGMTTSQASDLETLAAAREGFGPLPGKMIAIVESPNARADLALFRAEGVPRADALVAILDAMADNERTLLEADLGEGRDRLVAAQVQTVVGGMIAILLGLLLALVFRRAIAGPVQRLTGVASTITGGDLEARARVESRDEIGRLATTFNLMTTRLGETVQALRHRNEIQAEYIEQVGHLTAAAAAVEANEFDPPRLDGVSARGDALGQLARTFQRMAREVRAREERLRQEVRELKIEIDETRQAKRVAEITGTDYFRDLRARAAELRSAVGKDDKRAEP